MLTTLQINTTANSSYKLWSPFYSTITRYNTYLSPIFTSGYSTTFILNLLVKLPTYWPVLFVLTKFFSQVVASMSLPALRQQVPFPVRNRKPLLLGHSYKKRSRLARVMGFNPRRVKKTKRAYARWASSIVLHPSFQNYTNLIGITKFQVLNPTALSSPLDLINDDYSFLRRKNLLRKRRVFRVKRRRSALIQYLLKSKITYRFATRSIRERDPSEFFKKYFKLNLTPTPARKYSRLSRKVVKMYPGVNLGRRTQFKIETANFFVRLRTKKFGRYRFTKKQSTPRPHQMAKNHVIASSTLFNTIWLQRSIRCVNRFYIKRKFSFKT